MDDIKWFRHVVQRYPIGTGIVVISPDSVVRPAVGERIVRAVDSAHVDWVATSQSRTERQQGNIGIFFLLLQKQP